MRQMRACSPRNEESRSDPALVREMARTALQWQTCVHMRHWAVSDGDWAAEPIMPKVWNKRDPNCPKDAVYVGRPTKWGNPWSHLPSKDTRVMHVSDRLMAVECFESMMRKREDLQKQAREELRGKDLVCWCAPHDCHAETLLYYANQPDGTKV